MNTNFSDQNRFLNYYYRPSLNLKLSHIQSDAETTKNLRRESIETVAQKTLSWYYDVKYNYVRNKNILSLKQRTYRLSLKRSLNNFFTTIADFKGQTLVKKSLGLLKGPINFSRKRVNPYQQNQLLIQSFLALPIPKRRLKRWTAFKKLNYREKTPASLYRKRNMVLKSSPVFQVTINVVPNSFDRTIQNLLSPIKQRRGRINLIEINTQRPFNGCRPKKRRHKKMRTRSRRRPIIRTNSQR